jgi:hypothetical protein
VFVGLLLSIERQSADGQATNSTNASGSVNFTKLFQDKYTRAQTNIDVLKVFGNDSATMAIQDVQVRYESPTILINGELINEWDRTFNSNLWQAMEMLTNQYGFKLQHVMTSGVGSEGNPTSVYILMTK